MPSSRACGASFAQLSVKLLLRRRRTGRAAARATCAHMNAALTALKETGGLKRRAAISCEERGQAGIGVASQPVSLDAELSRTTYRPHLGDVSPAFRRQDVTHGTSIATAGRAHFARARTRVCVGTAG